MVIMNLITLILVIRMNKMNLLMTPLNMTIISIRLLLDGMTNTFLTLIGVGNVDIGVV